MCPSLFCMYVFMCRGKGQRVCHGDWISKYSRGIWTSCAVGKGPLHAKVGTKLCLTGLLCLHLPPDDWSKQPTSSPSQPLPFWSPPTPFWFLSLNVAHPHLVKPNWKLKRNGGLGPMLTRHCLRMHSSSAACVWPVSSQLVYPCPFFKPREQSTTGITHVEG